MDSPFDRTGADAGQPPGPGGAATDGDARDAAAREAAKARRIKLWSTGITLAILLALGAVAVEHVATEVDFAEVWAYLRGLPLWKVLEALGFTVAGYLVLTLYDVSALHHLRIKVKYATVALASFAGYAISNNVGWAVISGASVRYRVYSVAGLSAGTIAKVVVFSTTTFTLGVAFMGSLGMLVGPHPVATLLRLPEWTVQALAGGVLAFLAVVCVVSGVTHKPVRIGRWSFDLPSSKMVLAQIVIASAEIMLAGAALWLLLPEGHGASFFEFLGIFCAAMVVAMVSHVPGGLGVFESIMLLGLSAQGSASGVLGALLAFRFVYYVLPLFAAGTLLIGWELRTQSGPVARLWAKLRGRGPS